MDERMVHSPKHYTEGRKYEPKDVIRDWGLNFNLGSAVKYIARAGRKDDVVQDLEKAREYLKFEIDAIKATRYKTQADGLKKAVKEKKAQDKANKVVGCMRMAVPKDMPFELVADYIAKRLAEVLEEETDENS